MRRPFIFCAACSTMDKYQRIIVLWTKIALLPRLLITVCHSIEGCRAIAPSHLTDDDVNLKAQTRVIHCSCMYENTRRKQRYLITLSSVLIEKLGLYKSHSQAELGLNFKVCIQTD